MSFDKVIKQSRWTNIRIFYINLANYFGAGSFEKIGSKISQNLPHLRELTLDFESCYSQLHGEIFGILVSKISRNLLQLKYLNLKVSRCPITDEGIEDLAIGLQYLLKLERLHLFFEWCESVTDDSFIFLLNKISSYLICLKHLELNFRWCKYISSKSLNIISQKLLRNLSSLTELELYFSGCWRITENAVESLASGIKKYGQKINKIIIDLKGCYLLPYETLKKMETELSFIPKSIITY